MEVAELNDRARPAQPIHVSQFTRAAKGKSARWSRRSRPSVNKRGWSHMRGQQTGRACVHGCHRCQDLDLQSTRQGCRSPPSPPPPPPPSPLPSLSRLIECSLTCQSLAEVEDESRELLLSSGTRQLCCCCRKVQLDFHGLTEWGEGVGSEGWGGRAVNPVRGRTCLGVCASAKHCAPAVSCLRCHASPEGFFVCLFVFPGICSALTRNLNVSFCVAQTHGEMEGKKTVE